MGSTRKCAAVVKKETTWGSANGDCECLLMTMTGGGLCADTVISCARLIRCESDNVTCLAPNTICVNNTRCNEPVCYPIERASSEVCPPVMSTYSSSTSATTTTSLVISTASTIKSSTEITTTPTTTIEPTTITTTSLPTPTTVNACLNGSQCLNNGTCQPSGTSFFCLCPSTYHGTRCEYNGSSTDLSILEGILNGSLTNYDKTVESVLHRSNWTDILAFIDVTGSMQPCAAAVYKWMRLAYEKLNLIKYYVFFNDGDNRPDDTKVIGSTGGVYSIGTTDLNTVLATMQAPMKNGGGGDGPENDVEALLYGIHECSSCSNVIHIADNQVSPRDMILLSNVSKPIKLITCQLGTTPVNVDLINIADKTNGSIHTLEEDIVTLSGIPIGGTIDIGIRTYQRTATGYILLP